MREVLKQFEAVLSEQDLMLVPQGVEKLIKMYVDRHSSADERRAISQLLERKAAESSSRALTAYLRAAARCVREFSGDTAEPCPDEIPKPSRKAIEERPEQAN